MEHRFQINLRGLIDLLSNHLYSGPEVFVRELLQNGVDAIRAHKRRSIALKMGDRKAAVQANARLSKTSRD